MWKLIKPSLQTAKDDLNQVIAHCRSIKKEDKSAFEELYDYYDEGCGSISEEYHQQFVKDHSSQSKSMLQQYKKLNDGAHLDNIRAALFANAEVCPFCGFGEPATLDHYMPEGTYNELATCRLNLVPTCWKCNHEKHDNDYQTFIHSYYQAYPSGVVFFKCKVTARQGGILIFHYYIDDSGIDLNLAQKLAEQIRIIKLNERLKKESITYLRSIFFPEYLSNETDLRKLIVMRLNKARDILGLNDWHTALLSGLLNCEDLNLTILSDFLKIHTNSSCV